MVDQNKNTDITNVDSTNETQDPMNQPSQPSETAAATEPTNEPAAAPASDTTTTPETTPQPASSSASAAADESRQQSSNGIMALSLVIIVVAVLLFGGIYYYGGGAGLNLQGGATDAGTSTQNTGEQAVADLFDLPAPGTPIAIVNGVEVSATEYNRQLVQMATQAQQQGVPLTDEATRSGIEEQTIDMVINTELLLQAANESGVTVDDQAVEAELSRIQSSFETTEQYETQLANNDTSEEELASNIRKDLVLQAYIQAEANPADIEVSDAEIQAFYDQAASGNENVPPLAEVAPQIEQQLQQQQQQQVISDLLTQLRTEATIENLLN